MSIQDSDRVWIDRFNERVGLLSQSMGFESEFLHALNDDENDWSFIVKLHAVLEAAVNELLRAKLAEPALATMLIDRLNLSLRIDTLEELGIIDSDGSKRMRVLGKLRNKLVHDVRQIDFKLITLVDTVGKKKDFAENYIAPDLRSLMLANDDHPDWRARHAIWLSVIYVVAQAWQARDSGGTNQTPPL
jgi:DNA-binding MltR family transcriptional regulator